MMNATWKPGEALHDAQGEARWECQNGPFHDPSESPFVQRWFVKDLRLSRRLKMLSLDYKGIPSERLPWDVPLLRTAFLQLVQALSPNHLCLPEPIDLLRVKHPHLQEGLAQGEPLLVYAEPSGHPLRVLKGLSQQKRVHHMRRLCLYTAYALKDLHRHGCLLRALPLESMRRNPTNGSMSIAAFSSLCQRHLFTGFQRYEVGLHPARTHAAPECFTDTNELSPAADVYALGRLLLEALGEALPPQPYTEDELDQIIRRQKLPPFWGRFLKLTQRDTPDERFDGMQDVIVYVNSEGQHRSSKRKGPNAQPQTKRTDAPSASLLIWNPGLTHHKQRFQFKAFLRHCQRLYSLDTLLFFTYEQRDMNNAFFQFIRSLSFEVVPLTKNTPYDRVLQDTKARWEQSSRLLILGHGRQHGVRVAVDLAEQSGQTLSLFLTGGPQPQGVSCLETTSFLDKGTKSQKHNPGGTQPKQETNRR